MNAPEIVQANGPYFESMHLPERNRLLRRNYLRGLVAVGGTTGLAACLGATDNPPVPSGSPSDRPARQHAWNDALSTDEDGNDVLPKHHVLLPLRLEAAADETAREQVESALRSLERAYAYDHEGLLFVIGYTASYFDRFDGAGSPLPEPKALTSMETPEFDTFDAIVHLASDDPSVVIEAEEALLGSVESPNGIDMESTLSGVFERAEPRRTGFVGPGLPAEHSDLDGIPDSIPEEAPFFMGFRSGFDESQATEDRITIRSGQFAGGTTLQISSLDLQLETWFEQDSHDQRVAKMFSPGHASEDLVGTVGETLGTTNKVAGGPGNSVAENARNKGIVGHAQKAFRGRDEDGEPRLLRRDFNTVDGETPGVHFVSYQRSIDAFVQVREAMTGSDLAGGGVGQRLNNGILQYIFVRRRGNFVIPPRSKRSLPEP